MPQALRLKRIMVQGGKLTMPGQSGLGAFGSGQGSGQGSGRGRGNCRGMGGGRATAGPGGECICSSCGATTVHQAGVPCYQVKCPKCGTSMVRK